jgi:hypothetical protein
MTNPRNTLRPGSPLASVDASGTTAEVAAALSSLVDLIAAKAAEIVLGELEQREQEMPPASSSPYLSGWAAAADYLGLSLSTLKHAPGVPRRKVGGAVVFDRRELDAWLDVHFVGERRFQNGSTVARGGSRSGIAGARPPAK